ncbi:MAG TPA: FAD-binding oxidoreductase, partial [bacterium]|nr:FAD-binding oxidoreductase [bacterium]
CEMVVDCCGPWAQQLAERGGLKVPVEPYKRQLLMTHPFDAVGPAFPMLVDLHTGGYMRPETGGLMLGWADPAIPPGFDTTYDSDWEMQVIPICAERFPPLLEASILRGWAHMYDITPDHHPIIGRYPEVPNFLMAFGYSGHGVMSAPATGIALAELIAEGEAKTLDIHPFRITRFAEGDLLVERNVI